MNFCGNCCWHSELKEENIILPCINCSEKNNWIFKGEICLGGIPYADSDGMPLNHIEISSRRLAKIFLIKKHVLIKISNITFSCSKDISNP